MAKAILVLLLALLFVAFVFFVVGWVFMVSWNLFMAAAFGLPTISLMSGVAAVILLSLIGGLLRGYNAAKRQ